MPVKPHRSKVEVRSDAGSFLFLYLADTHMIEIHKRGQVFQIPLQDLVEFGRTSERTTFRVMPFFHKVTVDDDVVRQEFE